MTVDRNVGRACCRFVVVFFSVAAFLPSDLPADTLTPLHPVKRHPGVSNIDPVVTAKIQLARLRQTADQLRLLAKQPVPASLAGDARLEFAQQEAWLRQADHRITTLADQWEQGLKPSVSTSARTDSYGRLTDLNVFFQNQSTALQAKLRRENLAHASTTEAVQNTSGTVRLVIDKMN